MKMQEQNASVLKGLHEVYLREIDQNGEILDSQLHGYQTEGGLLVTLDQAEQIAKLLESSPITNRGTYIDSQTSQPTNQAKAHYQLTDLTPKSLETANIAGYSVGVDYIRLSRPNMTDEWGAKLEYFKELNAKGNFPREFRQRYGWHGVALGDFSYGSNDAENSNQKGWVFVEAYGDLAGDVLREFAFLATNCSRVDLEVTVRMKEMDHMLGREIFADLERRDNENLRRTTNGKPPVFDIIQGGSGRGDTLYLGARVSKSRLKARLYNKDRQSKDRAQRELYENCWRYETQLAEENSSAFLAFYVVQTVMGNCPLDNPQIIAGLVLGYFASKYVPVPNIAAVDPLFLPKMKRKTDIERRWAWFDRQVRPAVEELIEIDDYFTIKCLGLADYIGAARMIQHISYADIQMRAMQNLGFGGKWLAQLSDDQKGRVWDEITRIIKTCFRQVKPIELA